MMITIYSDFFEQGNSMWNKTIEMFQNFLDWRKEYRADEAMVIYKCPNIEKVKEFYHHGYHGTDLEGRPFYIDQPCTFNITDILKVWEQKESYVYYIKEYERLLHIRLPACSAAAGKKIEQSFSLINVKGFNMGKLKLKSREFIKLAIKIGQDYYPEIMGKMFIINTPFLFKGAWALFSPFIDAKTKNKISMLGSSYKKELDKYVDPQNVPAEIGGECTCKHHEKGWFFSDIGPWNEFPGDEIGEAAKKALLEEEKLDNFGKDLSISESQGEGAEQESKEIDENMIKIDLEASQKPIVSENAEENHSPSKKFKSGWCSFLCWGKKNRTNSN